MDRRVKVWALASVLVVLGGLFTILVLLSGRAQSVKKTVMERWAETIGTPEEVFAEYPTRKMNEGARDLIDATLSFGIDSAPRYDETLPRPQVELKEKFRTFKIHSGSWFRNQLAKTIGPTDQPPAESAAFLDEFRAEIDHVQDVLLSDSKPEWKRDLTLLFASPSPNLLGHVDLNKLLLADTLAALAGGDIERAERALEAAWELAELLSDNPEMIAHTIRFDLVQSQAVVIRHMPWLDHWASRLDPAEMRESAERALLHEGWQWPQFDFGPGPQAGVWDRIQHAVSGPFITLGTADASERWRRAVLRLNALPAWCRPALDRLAFGLDVPMPWWNRFGEIFVFDLERTVALVAQTQLQFELTRRVLEMAATYRSTGNWPVASEPWLRSRVCPQDRWVYTVDGTLASIKLDREIVPASAGTQAAAAWEFALDAASLPQPEPSRRN